MSGNASRTRGRARELRYRDKLRDEGWWCERIDGCADLVALKAGERPVLLQVKSTLSRYSHFPACDRAALREEAKAAGATCALIWWPRGVGIQKAEWVDECEFPGARLIAASLAA